MGEGHAAAAIFKGKVFVLDYIEELKADVLRPLVRYNFGDQAAAKLTPNPSLGYTAQTDMASMMTAIALLARSNYLHPSQFAALDAQLGLPPRDLTQETATPAHGASPVAEPGDDPDDEAIDDQEPT